MKKQKLLRWCVPLLFAWVGYTWLSGSSGLINQFQLQKHNNQLHHQVDSLIQTKKDLDITRSRLRNDTAYLEKVIRSELGWAKPGEKVFRLRNYTNTY